MKKIITWLLIIMLLFSMHGCGNNSGIKSDTGTTEAEMNGMETKQYTVAEDETGSIEVSIEKKSGKLSLIIYKDGSRDKPAYKGNDLVSSVFTVFLNEPGEYILEAEGNAFIGTYSFKFETEKIKSVSSQDKAEENTAENDEDSQQGLSFSYFGPWHLDPDKNSQKTLESVFMGYGEFGEQMEIRSNGQISFSVGAVGGYGTYSCEGDVLKALICSYENNEDEEYALKLYEDGQSLYITMELEGQTLTWIYGDRESWAQGNTVYDVELFRLSEALLNNIGGEDAIKEGLDFLADYAGSIKKEEIGYGLLDIDGCGKDELIIGFIPSEEGSFYPGIFQIYKKIDETGTLMLNAYARDKYYLLSNGLILEIGSLNASEEIYNVYSPEDGVLNLSESLLVATNNDGVSYEYTSSGKTESIDGAKGTQIISEYESLILRQELSQIVY